MFKVNEIRLNKLKNSLHITFDQFGTGRHLNLNYNNYEMAGKTGTVQVRRISANELVIPKDSNDALAGKFPIFVIADMANCCPPPTETVLCCLEQSVETN